MDLLLNSTPFHYGVKCSFHGEKFSPRCFSSLSCQQHFHICTKHRKILFLLKALRDFYFFIIRCSSKTYKIQAILHYKMRMKVLSLIIYTSYFSFLYLLLLRRLFLLHRLIMFCNVCKTVLCNVILQ